MLIREIVLGKMSLVTAFLYFKTAESALLCIVVSATCVRANYLMAVSVILSWQLPLRTDRASTFGQTLGWGDLHHHSMPFHSGGEGVRRGQEGLMSFW